MLDATPCELDIKNPQLEASLSLMQYLGLYAPDIIHKQSESL